MVKYHHNLSGLTNEQIMSLITTYGYAGIGEKVWNDELPLPSKANAIILYTRNWALALDYDGKIYRCSTEKPSWELL